MNSGPRIALASLYDDAEEGWDLDREEKRAVEAYSTPGASAYGEIPEDSARRLLAWLRPGPDDVFLDLGSGAGRLVMQVALETPVGLAAGIEAAPTRDALARRALARAIERGRDDLAERVRFRAGDLAALDWPPATVIYMGSTCFSDDLMIAIARRAVALPRLRLIASTRDWPAAAAARFRARADWNLPMTWADKVTLRLHEPRR